MTALAFETRGVCGPLSYVATGARSGVPRPFEVLRASRLFELRGDLPRRRRTHGRDGSLEAVCSQPKRFRIASLERPIDFAQRRWIVRSKELDDLFEEPAIASSVRERGGLVEDRLVRLL